jgi:DNA polymerase elongation subunit (family B)
MHNFYTSVLCRGNNILVREIVNGKRIKRSIPYQPTLFASSSKKIQLSEWTGLYGEPLTPIKFDSINDARNWVKSNEDVSNFSVHGQTNWQYAWVAENYPGEVHYDKSLMRIANIDIEVANEYGGFPDPELAREEVTATTVKIADKYHVFSCLKYTPHLPNIRFVKCDDERDLLATFVDWWSSDHPDVVTGWHIGGFDIVYLVNRISKIFDEKMADRLSPWGYLDKRTTTIGGKTSQQIDIPGIAVLDALELYRKFVPVSQESYKLGYIGQLEVGEGKTEFDGSLTDLYKRDPQLYLQYNVQDTDLVEKIINKKALLDTAFMVAYFAHSNLSDVFTQVRMWDNIINATLMEEKRVVPPKVNNGGKSEKYEGAWVKDVLVGMHEWVVSFDFASLYPSLIIQYNISPETFIDKIELPDVDNLLKLTPGTKLEEKYSLAANGCRYTKEFEGVLPRMARYLFDKRNALKRKQLDAETELQHETDETKRKSLEQTISYFKLQQSVTKVLTNSMYGAVGNQWFRFYDVDNAEAITISGQLMVRWAVNKVNDYINKLSGTTDVDYCCAADTDSGLFTLKTLVDKVFAGKTPTNDQVVDFLDKAVKDRIQPYIDKVMLEISDMTNCYEPRMVMKREKIAISAVWRAKKTYCALVADNEGVRYAKPKLSITGMEAVKSSTPGVCRDKIKEGLQLILEERSEDAIQKFVTDFEDEWSKFSIEEIAFPRGVNGLKKYADPKTIWSKEDSVPQHVRASLLYNHLVKTKKSRAPLISEGDKIKFVCLKEPNPWRSNAFAFPEHLPDELDVERWVDRTTQFEKAFLAPINSVCECLGWSARKRYTLF